MKSENVRYDPRLEKVIGKGAKVHVMGLEGVGMSGLAELLLAEGYGISGCDLSPGQRCQKLSQLGAGPIQKGHDPNHLQDEKVLLLPTPIQDNHPEVMKAKKRGMRVLKRMELLRAFLSERPSLGVTGTHGKTTTTGMLASIFLEADLDPWVFLGGETEPFGNVRYGLGPRLAEVDESDYLFQEVQVDVAVITNLDIDHISPDGHFRPNYYPSYEALEEAVLSFGQKANTLIFPSFHPGLFNLFKGLPSAQPFGPGGVLWAENIELKPFGSRFVVVFRGKTLGEVRLEVPGIHNLQNALAATLASLLFGVSFSKVQRGLARYQGVKRRFERLGVYRGAILVDDYAHHPTEIRATLEAAKSTGLKVKALFQPHRLGRTQSLWKEFAQSLLLADEVVVLPVYTAGEEENDKDLAEKFAKKITNEIQSQGGKALFLRAEEAQIYLEKNTTSGEILVSLGAGDLNRILKDLLKTQKQGQRPDFLKDMSLF